MHYLVYNVYITMQVNNNAYHASLPEDGVSNMNMLIQSMELRSHFTSDYPCFLMLLAVAAILSYMV